MQKTRFYDRMMIAGFIRQVLFAGHEINGSRSDYRCSGGRSFLCIFDVSIRESKHLVNFL